MLEYILVLAVENALVAPITDFIIFAIYQKTLTLHILALI